MDNNYYKVGQVLVITKLLKLVLLRGRIVFLQSRTILLQSGTGITKCDNFFTKYDGYYKMGQLLQRVIKG